MTLLLLASGSSKVILHFPPNTAPLRVSWFGAPGLSPSPLLRHSCSAEGLLMSRLYPRKPSNGSSALRFNSCPIYLEFLSLSQLPPLYTSGIVLGHWAPSQRQSMANPSHSHSASFPPLAGKKKKKSTSYSICEEIVFTIVVPSLPLWFSCRLFSLSQTWLLILKIRF